MVLELNFAKEHPIQENWFASSRQLGIHRRRKSTHLSASSLNLPQQMKKRSPADNIRVASTIQQFNHCYDKHLRILNKDRTEYYDTEGTNNRY